MEFNFAKKVKSFDSIIFGSFCIGLVSKVDRVGDDISASLNMSMQTVSETAAVALTTVLSVLVVLVIVGNCLVCFIVKRNRDVRYANI